jgi:hypothetical protein
MAPSALPRPDVSLPSPAPFRRHALTHRRLYFLWDWVESLRGTCRLSYHNGGMKHVQVFYFNFQGILARSAVVFLCPFP